MRLAGVEAVVGSANFHEHMTGGVRAWETAFPASAAAIKSATIVGATK